MIKIPAMIKAFCDALWEYNDKTDQVYIYHDNMTPHLCGQWMDYEEIYNLYVEQYVCRSDISIWKHFFASESLKAFLAGEKQEDQFYLRFEHTKNGSEWHEVFLEKIGDHRLLMGGRDIQRIKANAVMTQAMLPEFDCVCAIDIKTGSYLLYNAEFKDTVLPASVSDDYHQILHEFNGSYIVPEECEEVTSNMEIEHVVDMLKHREEYILFATIVEKGEKRYKKIRFCYSDETRSKLLMTRMDISSLMQERKLRKEEERKHLEYLESMPVAFCEVKVLLDEDGKPYDLVYTYSNPAHAELEGVKEGELLGKQFYQYYKEADPKWLSYFYETACHGTMHSVNRYSPELKKHLQVYTFQTEPGHCGCVLQNVSEEHFLEEELSRNQEEMKHILEISTDLVFQYLPGSEKIILKRLGKDDTYETFSTKDLLAQLANFQCLEPSGLLALEDGFERIRKGAHKISVSIRARKVSSEKLNWYRLTMFDFKEGQTHTRKVLGYMQNIEQDMLKQEKLRRRAQTDSLTRVLNSGTGKMQVHKILQQQKDSEVFWNALFLMDIDDFKTINDSMGHMIGDEVLQEFAKMVKQTFRSGDIVYRLGGDEFVVFARELKHPNKNVAAIMRRFSTNMRRLQERYPFLSSSVGVCVAEGDHAFEHYYENADQALYQTKKSGKNHYTVISRKQNVV